MAFTSEHPGTTRDIVEEVVFKKGINWICKDTAGVRKKSKIYGRKADPVEIFSVGKALKELKKADFAVFLVEAQRDARLKSQDRKLLNLIRSSLVPSIILVNKWDTVRKDWTEKDYRNELRLFLGDLDFLPILFVSAKTGFHIENVFQILNDLNRRRQKISTSRLNKWLQETLQQKAPRVAKRGRTSPRGRSQTQYLKIHYAVHTSEDPMSFQLFCNAPQAVADDDKRFLMNRLRKDFSLQGIPLRFTFRKKT